MANELYSNSGQTFKTHITEEGDPTTTVDASDFTEALYRIFDSDNTTVLVTSSLTGGEIAVVVDVDSEGNNINVFETTLTKTQMLDSVLVAGQYKHQFKVTNAASLELPPIFQEQVNIREVCD